MEHIGSSTNGKRVATVEAMQSSSSERAKHLGKAAVKIDFSRLKNRRVFQIAKKTSVTK